ncbi:MAG TPA: hypothetical protein VHP38_13910, partial [Ruminiclostridium sp.]|nr:hypothetical protein [Ruminiclostridium sp.]
MDQTILRRKYDRIIRILIIEDGTTEKLTSVKELYKEHGFKMSKYLSDTDKVEIAPESSEPDVVITSCKSFEKYQKLLKDCRIILVTDTKNTRQCMLD